MPVASLQERFQGLADQPADRLPLPSGALSGPGDQIPRQLDRKNVFGRRHRQRSRAGLRPLNIPISLPEGQPATARQLGGGLAGRLQLRQQLDGSVQALRVLNLGGSTHSAVPILPKTTSSTSLSLGTNPTEPVPPVGDHPLKLKVIFCVRGVFSPLLANIVLNYLDWRLDQRGYRFVRYADDFVVLTQSKAQAEEALAFVAQTLEQLELKLSPDKTRITTYKGGYSFLGFVMSRRSRRMRPKSEQKFQDKVRQLTPRHHNLDATVIKKLNQVIRGTALYFTPRWATSGYQVRELDKWVRMRLRAMWSKRKRLTDNYRLPNRKLAQLGLLSLTSFCCRLS